MGPRNVFCYSTSNRHLVEIGQFERRYSTSPVFSSYATIMITHRKGSVWQAGPHCFTWCIVGRPCTTTCCGRTGVRSVFLACQSLETASPACGKGLYDSWVKWRFRCFWIGSLAASVSSTGRPSGSLAGTTATSLRPCPCAMRSSCAARHDGLTFSVTQPWSPFLLMALAVSHNAPGWNHLNHSTSTALIWRSFRGEQSRERRLTDIRKHNWSEKDLLHSWNANVSVKFIYFFLPKKRTRIVLYITV